jgi:hypothetical protein
VVASPVPVGTFTDPALVGAAAWSTTVTGRRGQHWRQLTVWLHVVTSVAWMGQALALASLLTLSLATRDPSVRVSATTMANHLDVTLLANLANASAFTGFFLAAATPWGFFRHWWVLAKFTITVVQLYLGIFVLSDSLRESEVAARAGAPAPPTLALGAVLMASAMAFQAWVSIPKPWGRTPWAAAGARGRAAKLPTASEWMFAAAVLAVLADLVDAAVLGHPAPVFCLLVLGVRLVLRRRELRSARSGRPAAPTMRAGQLAGEGG